MLRCDRCPVYWYLSDLILVHVIVLMVVFPEEFRCRPSAKEHYESLVFESHSPLENGDGDGD